MKRIQKPDLDQMYHSSASLTDRWQPILEHITQETGFQPRKDQIRQSQWWKTGKIGAVSLNGIYQNKPAVLKIQGAKPNTSEVKIITAFEEQNQSHIIRAPHILWHQPWQEAEQYEATIFERIEAPPVITTRPASKSDREHFFSLYQEYRRRCRNQPFIKKEKTFSYLGKIKEWQEKVKVEQQQDQLQKPEDKNLINQAVQIIEQELSIDDFEFVHGHFYPGDLLVINSKEVVVFSHLFWGWRNPFYDAVFGYAWRMLELEHVKGLTLKQHQLERQRWLQHITNLPQVKNHPQGKHLIHVALLERTAASLVIDRFMMDQTRPQAEIITESTRQELQRLLDHVSS